MTEDQKRKTLLRPRPTARLAKKSKNTQRLQQTERRPSEMQENHHRRHRKPEGANKASAIADVTLNDAYQLPGNGIFAQMMLLEELG
ncbi:Hypothetical predicted protein [Olea europaea subsp. europaea]|uniref:Uncharacterized protein n=1 Tax=Olea europaea subsp. europaea TaxID=158383 RepID=A0A8S0T6D5_OLEEU|nr:Hypothetical predicted protein [Olea europaea subsp. europaea]